MTTTRRNTIMAESNGPDWHLYNGDSSEVLADLPDLAGFDVYASGPPAMVEAIRDAFPRHGLPREQLFFDSFDYAPDTLAKLQGAAPPGPQ